MSGLTWHNNNLILMPQNPRIYTIIFIPEILSAISLQQMNIPQPLVSQAHITTMQEKRD